MSIKEIFSAKKSRSLKYCVNTAETSYADEPTHQSKAIYMRCLFLPSPPEFLIITVIKEKKSREIPRLKAYNHGFKTVA